MTRGNLPDVTFIISTYNEEERIKACLESIFSQDYPRDKMEVIVVDGMSCDRTVNVAKKYPAKIVFNEKKIAGSARRIGTKVAKGEFLAFLDADIELPKRNWLRLMIAPMLNDPDVAGTLTLILPKADYPAISRCFALTQADPVIAFSYNTGKSVKSTVITKKNYFPMGSFLLRKDLVVKVGNFKSFLPRSEDVDLTYRLVEQGYKFVIVPQAGIYHLFANSFSSFLRKTCERISLFWELLPYCDFDYVLKMLSKRNFLKNILYHFTGIGALVQMVKGIRRDRDLAWLYYPIIVQSTIFIYTVSALFSRNGRNTLKRILTHQNSP